MENIKQLKKVARKSTSNILKGLSDELIRTQSSQLTKHATGMAMLNEYSNFSLYLSMKKELQTDGLLKWLFQNNKRVFVPRVVGKNPQDMTMPELRSIDEMNQMNKTKWGIPEFTPDQLENRTDGIDEGLIDFVLAPGVSFSDKCLRLGHGGGYYDCFLSRLQDKRKEKGLKPAFVMGLALEEQIVDTIPTTEYDVVVDAVITPTKLFLKDKPN